MNPDNIKKASDQLQDYLDLIAAHFPDGTLLTVIARIPGNQMDQPQEMYIFGTDAAMKRQFERSGAIRG